MERQEKLSSGSRYYTLFSRLAFEDGGRKKMTDFMGPALKDDCMTTLRSNSSSSSDACLSEYSSTMSPESFENYPGRGISSKSMQHDYKNKSRIKARKPFCEFCKNNNEQRSVYSSHVLKDMDGRVVCPVSFFLV